MAATTNGARAHRPSRRAVVLAAALAEFTDRGYGAVSMASIAARADMSVAAIYYHVKAKDAVLLELLDEVGRSLIEAMVAVCPDPDPGRSVRGIIAAYGRWMAASPLSARLYAGAGTTGATATVEEARRAQQVVVTRLVAGRLGGDQPDLEVLIAAVAVEVLFREFTRAVEASAGSPTELLDRAEQLAVRVVTRSRSAG